MIGDPLPVKGNGCDLGLIVHSLVEVVETRNLEVPRAEPAVFFHFYENSDGDVVIGADEGIRDWADRKNSRAV